MYTVLLSGGSGKRLWPLSNDLRSKQYIKLINKENSNEQCSMVQRVWSQLEEHGLGGRSVICASAAQVEIIKSQLGDVDIAVEPMRRDTFAAVALSCAYLVSRLGASREDTVAILPVDPYTEGLYFETVKNLGDILKDSGADIALMGAIPNEPSTKFGYIVPGEKADGYVNVKEFREKPTLEDAKLLLKEGAYWNCGVFCFRIGLVLDLVEKRGVSTDYQGLFESYERLPKISFDYEVLENSDKLVATAFDGIWKDLGTWNSLAEEMAQDTVGNVLLDATCTDTQVINELDIPIVAMGAKDMIVVASPDGILVADKAHSANLKDATGNINLPPMFEERRWGSIKIIDVSKNENGVTSTRKIHFLAGKNSSYHYHSKRDEAWTILSGSGEMIIEGNKFNLSAGMTISIPRGKRHAIKAYTDMDFIEIHIGETIGDTDIIRKTFNYDEIKLL